MSSLQLLTWKLNLSAYQGAFYQAHCAAFPALLPQGLVLDLTAGKATHCKSTHPHIDKDMARIQKKET